jgi:hypothetical protein
MNWLIYIAGWIIGWALINTIINAPGANKDITLFMKIITWSLVWVWICWKFIR